MSDQKAIGNTAVAEAPAKPVLLSFTPSLMSAETLWEIFVARQPLVDRLVRDIRDATTSHARRHALLVGPHGIGKTHLVSMVYHTVRADAAMYDRLRIAWLREEEWSVFSYADLLVRIFRALANEYAQERAALSALADRLMRLPIKEGEAVGEAKLLEWLGDRLLLLIVENVNDLFAGMGESGQQALRAFLQNHSRAILLTTSPELTLDLSAHDAPFYGYFNVTHLKDLTHEEARQLLHKIAAEVEHDQELADYLLTEEADRRLRVIEMLAGGHPRIWVLFSGCMSRQNLDELVPLFLKMLDDLTPYYQDRMRALPPQERRLIAYLCERSGAVLVKEIAEDCRLKPNHAAALLGKLEEKGYVRKAPEPTPASGGDRRSAYYEIREPLMRLCIEVKRNRAVPLRLIVEFLRCWFSKQAIPESIHAAECALDQILLASIKRDLWPLKAMELTLAFAEADALPSLANGLAQTIRTLASEIVTDTLAQSWLAAWEAAAYNHPELDVALRLLRTAVEWKRTRNRGALLRLASEERAVLEELLPHQ